MKTMKKRTSTVVLTLFALLLMAVCGFQFAWAEDGTLAVGDVDGDLTAQEERGGEGAGELEEQESGDFITSDGLVGVYNITSGKVSYDPTTQVLTLDNVDASIIHFLKDGSLTLSLIGENNTTVSDAKADGYSEWDDVFWEGTWIENQLPACTGSITITGTGTLSESIDLQGDITVLDATLRTDSLRCNNLTIEEGTVEACGAQDWNGYYYGGTISCSGNLTISGGALQTPSEGSATVSCEGDLLASAGTLSVSGGSDDEGKIICGGTFTAEGAAITSNRISCKDMIIEAGSVKVTGYDYDYDNGYDSEYDYDSNSYGVRCSGNLTISGGSLSAKYGTHCDGSVTVSGGKLTGYMNCAGNLIATKGTLNCDPIICGGNLTAGGAAITAIWISCTNMIVKAGTVKSTETCNDDYDSNSSINCKGSFTMSGGSLSATYGTHCKAKAIASGGTLTGGLTCDANITASGATLSGNKSCTGSLTATKGTLKGGFISCGGKLTGNGATITANWISCKSLDMKAGTIKTTKYYEDDEAYYYNDDDYYNTYSPNYGILCSGSFTIIGGSLSASYGTNCGNATLSGGTFSGDLDCDGNLNATKGTLNSGSISCGGKLTAGGATITATWISCGSMVMKAGTVKATGSYDRSYDKYRYDNYEYYDYTDSYEYDNNEYYYDYIGVYGENDHDYSSICSINCGNLAITGGNLSSARGFYCSSATLSGGVLSGGMYCTGNLTATKGTMKGGRISCGGKLTAGGASISATRITSEYMVVKAGTVNTTGKSGITCVASFAMSGGTVTVPKAYIGIEVGQWGDYTLRKFNVTGGKILITNPIDCGICVNSGNAVIKGGTVSVTNSYGSGISVNSNADADVDTSYYRTTYGGKMSVTGGALTSTVRKPNSNPAIEAKSMSNKASCLKSIVGGLPKGASFTVNKITYAVLNDLAKGRTAAISLASGNFSSLPNNVKFGKVSYGLQGFSPCASRMPTGSTSTWTSEFKSSIKILSGTGVVSIKGKTVTALKPGTATVGLYANGAKIAERKITVYALSGKYLMQSCMKGKSGMCLDMNGASKANGAQMIVWGKNGGNNQKFTFLKQKDGSYVVKSVNSGKVLDVNGASKAWGQNVIQWQANGGANQKWRISVDAANRATFTNVNSKLVFDVSGGKADWGAPMIQWGANGGLNQKWTLVAVK